jgi:hypothetical protein
MGVTATIVAIRLQMVNCVCLEVVSAFTIRNVGYDHVVFTFLLQS